MAQFRESINCNKHLCESKIYATRDHSLAMQALKKKILSEGIANFETDPRYVRLMQCKKTVDETYYSEQMCKNLLKPQTPQTPQTPPTTRPQAQPQAQNLYKYVSLIDPEQYKQNFFRISLNYFLEKKFPIGTVFIIKYSTAGFFSDMLQVWLPLTKEYFTLPKETLVNFELQPQSQPWDAPPNRPPQPQPQPPLDPCTAGKIRNPATGRCINDPALKATKKTAPKKASPAKTQKACPAGKIRNPATGRCINDPALKATKKTAPKKASPAKTQKAQKPCAYGKIRNPATGRCINDPALKAKK